MEWLLGFLEEFTYLGIFVALCAAGFGVPLSEDVVLLLSGLLAYAGYADLAGVMAVCWIGVVAADTISYAIGRGFGARVLSTRWARIAFHPRRLRRVRRWFARYGAWAVFGARFMVGLRSAAIFTAGAQRFPYPRFLLADGTAALLHVPLIVGIGYLFSHAVGTLERGLRVMSLVLIAVAVAAVVGWILRDRRKRRS